MTKYIFSPDKHVGWERGNKKLKPLHDEKAIAALMAFARDFQPDVWIEGGDNLDCGPVSHWIKDKKLSSKDLSLKRDCDKYTELVLDPLSKIPSIKKKYWMVGNHEAWLDQLAEARPGLTDLLDVEHLLDLQDWTVVKQGKHVKLGKLYFVHGDNIGNSKTGPAKAINDWDHSVRFGHFHTFSAGTKHSPIHSNDIRTGIAIPGLCKRNPNYASGKPNQWMQGFNFGYIRPDGTFNDYTPIIVNGIFTANGKTYGD